MTMANTETNRPTFAANFLSATLDHIARIKGRIATRHHLATLRDKDLRDIGLERPRDNGLLPSFDAATRLSIRANGGTGLL